MSSSVILLLGLLFFVLSLLFHFRKGSCGEKAMSPVLLLFIVASILLWIWQFVQLYLLFAWRTSVRVQVLGFTVLWMGRWRQQLITTLLHPATPIPPPLGPVLASWRKKTPEAQKARYEMDDREWENVVLHIPCLLCVSTWPMPPTAVTCIMNTMQGAEVLAVLPPVPDPAPTEQQVFPPSPALLSLSGVRPFGATDTSGFDESTASPNPQLLGIRRRNSSVSSGSSGYDDGGRENYDPYGEGAHGGHGHRSSLDDVSLESTLPGRGIKRPPDRVLLLQWCLF